MYVSWVPVDFAMVIGVFVHRFNGLVYNSAMKVVHFYLVCEKLLDLMIDFVLGPAKIALCYELGLESWIVDFLH